MMRARYSMPAAFVATTMLITAWTWSPLAAQVASPEPTKVAAGTYKVETHHTQVLFGIDHFGFNPYHGIVSGATGTVTLDPAAPAKSRVDVTLPVASITTTNAPLDAELKGPDWFDTAKFPDARFVSPRVTSTGGRTARIDGTLTLHGVTKPVTLDATFGGAGTNPLSKAVTAGFTATGTIKRSEFGVTKYLPLVGDDVTLTISAAFEKAA